MSDAQNERLLVNLRPHVVEVHLTDRVITVGPMGSAPIPASSPQVDELVPEVCGRLLHEELGDLPVPRLGA